LELMPKRLELLSELVPQASVFALLVNPNNAGTEPMIRHVQEIARAKGLKLHVLKASTESEIDTAFAALVQQQAGALVVSADPFFNNRREQLVALAALHTVPAMYELREFAAVGGLISYAPSLTAAYRQVGIYVGKILKGANPRSTGPAADDVRAGHQIPSRRRSINRAASAIVSQCKCLTPSAERRVVGCCEIKTKQPKQPPKPVRTRLVWGFFCQAVVFGLLFSSLFGAGRPFFVPSPGDQVRGARGRGQGTETLAQLGGLPPSVACVSQRLDARARGGTMNREMGLFRSFSV
jgi:hypothetical protein